MENKINHQLLQNSRKVTALIKNFISEVEQHKAFQIKKFPKNSFLISRNEVNSNIFFIKKGCVRSFVYDQDLNEVTIWFSFENQAIYSSTSYILEIPSEVMIQALEDSEVVVISKQNMRFLYDTKPHMNQLGRIIMENFLILLSLRSLSLQTTLAETRYHALTTQYPDILQRVSLRHIASFIGVKMETLSRIRANFRS